MSSKLALETKKKVAQTVMPAYDPVLQQRFALPRHRDTASATVGEAMHATSVAPGFDYDYSQIPNHPPVATEAQSCPLASPRACPFGGACHTCPVRLQAKLMVNQPGDEYEQEADWVAGQVMRMPALQAPANTAASSQAQSSTVPPIVHEVLRSPGQPLDPAARAFFEPRFGCDFGQVRVHTDEKAAESAWAVNALAYTVGQDIVFGAGQFMPDTLKGCSIIAHELMHVIQQGRAAPVLQRWVAPLDWLDYVGLTIDVAERIYIELAYKPGQEKEFQQFVNTIFFAIDLILAAAPGVGGGGVAIRASHGAAAIAWEAFPNSAKARVAEEVAKRMGWSIAKATQMTNRFFGAKAKGPPESSTSSESKPPRQVEERREEIVKEFAEAQRSVPPGTRALEEAVGGVSQKFLRAVYEKHHLFVQELRRWFRSRGFDIDKYTIKLSADEHRLIHNEYRWNDIWKDFMKQNPTASKKAIRSQLKDMIKKYGLEGLRIVPY